VKRLNVLIVDETASAALATKRALSLGGHEATMTTFTAPELPQLLEKKWDAIVVEWVRQRPGTAELIATVRQRDRGTSIIGHEDPTFLVVATAKPIESTIEAAFAAGADDFVHKPIVKEELFVRLAGLERAAARRGEQQKSSGSGAALHCVQASPYAMYPCWKTFDERAALCVTQLLDRKVGKIALAAMKGFRATQASSVLLSLPEKATEFRLIIEIEGSALEDIGRDLYGDISPGVLLDILYEMANTVGGSFMRAGIEENMGLTTSLPSSFAVHEIRSVLEHADARTSVYLEDASGGRMAIHLTVRERRNVFVPVSRLREGMVLARDLIADESGALLLKAGTRITTTAGERVMAILGADVTVEVADCAA